ncbi:hypothetical protein EDC01DRAFT_634966 [Geopyxis carbonaria]|nr:hypothetical protein EDC01DRAFT_634966 [Geopyxis carbonaria]
MLFLLLTSAASLLTLAGASASLPRPACTLTPPSIPTAATTLTFDTIPIVPCAAISPSTPYHSLYLTYPSGAPARIDNTSSTPTCHTHSGGGGPFGMAVSAPNAAGTSNGTLILSVANGTSFNYVGASWQGKFDRAVYAADQDPVVIGRARGWDACGHLVAVDTQAFYEMRRGAGPYVWRVTERERWERVQRVELVLRWWWVDASGVATGKAVTAWVDDVEYVL